MSHTPLLEREQHLADLGRRLAEAASGQGNLVFLAGEAGVGKTALVSHFLASLANSTRTLTGCCDPATVPSPLWPLREMAVTSRWPPAIAIGQGAGRDDILQLAYADLRDGAVPTVMTIEDAHWADDSTLDFIRFLGRRIQNMPVLAIVTYRNDEVRLRKRLHLVQGDLATAPAVGRMILDPLSIEAVAEMATGHSVDVKQLFERSLGNPFLVTELLSSDGAVPESIKFGVFARIESLADPATQLLEMCAIYGPSTDRCLVEAISDGEHSRSVEDCIESGMVLEDASRITFRHELIREAILSNLSQSRLRELSSVILAALMQLDSGADPALLARLAENAEQTEDMARFAILAGDRALELRSYREASAQYRRALDSSDGLPVSDRSRILHMLAESTFYCGRGRTGIEVLTDLIELLHEQEDWPQLAEHYSWLAGIHIEDCRMDEALFAMKQALVVIEMIPDNPSRLRVHVNHAYVLSLCGNHDDAILEGQRALSLGQEYGDNPAIWLAMIVIGSSRLALQTDDSEGIRFLEDAARLCENARVDGLALFALCTIGSYFVNSFRPDLGREYLDSAVALSTECELICWRRFAEYCIGISCFYKGDWDGAATWAPVMSLAEAGCLEGQITGMLIIGRIRARRGDPDAITLIDSAASLTPADAPPYVRCRLHLARAEASWLAGDTETTRREAQEGIEAAVACHGQFSAGELVYYLGRTAQPVELPFTMLTPHRMELAGDWIGAASAWQDLQCPYEEARARFEAGDPDSLLVALAMFGALGAVPMADLTKRKLRDCGVPIPRGPRTATRGNQFGLTTREAEILHFVQLGWTNNEIADRLFVSSRTVEHHVSSIFGKMGVRSRREVNPLLQGGSGQRPTESATV